MFKDKDYKKFTQHREKFTSIHHPGMDDSKAPEFYLNVIKNFNIENNLHGRKIAFIVVAHFVHTLPYFLEGISSLGDIAALISKQSGVVKEVHDTISSIYKNIFVKDINKGSLKEEKDGCNIESWFSHLVEKWEGYQFIILDHGGYFAPRINDVLQKFKDKIIGIVEHTWNGEVRYQQQLDTASNFPVPIISIAHSLLKDFESAAVARSVIDALENNMAGIGLNQDTSRLSRILIIGYGRLGSRIALYLRRKLHDFKDERIIRIYDSSEEALKEAQKFFLLEQVTDDINRFLGEADLIITATSTQALENKDFLNLKPGCVIACATSSDDQFKEDALIGYSSSLEKENKHNKSCVKYENGDKYFYLLCNGDSVNFSVGSTAHPVVHAILASILVNANDLINKQGSFSLKQIHLGSSENGEKLQGLYEQQFGPISNEYIDREWNLPAKSDFFIGRNHYLKKINKWFEKKKSVIIYGPGGIGKSQLVIEYARDLRYSGNYLHILYFPARNIDILKSSYQALAAQLELIDNFAYSQKIKNNLEIWLNSQQKKCLIIYDNVESEIPPEQFLNISSQHDVLIASRLKTLKVGFQCIKKELRQFTEKESSQYIYLKLSKKFTLAEETVNKLGDNLSHFPLALDMACSYINKVKDMTIEKFLEEYKSKKVRLFSVDKHWSIVLKTLNIAYPQIINEKNLRLLLKILDYLCFLNNESLHFSIIQNIFSEFDFEMVKEHLVLLAEYSIITIDETNQLVSIHRLIQEILRFKYKNDEGNTFKDRLNIYNQLKTIFEEIFTIDIDGRRQATKYLSDRNIFLIGQHLSSIAEFLIESNSNTENSEKTEKIIYHYFKMIDFLVDFYMKYSQTEKAYNTLVVFFENLAKMEKHSYRKAYEESYKFFTLINQFRLLGLNGNSLFVYVEVLEFIRLKDDKDAFDLRTNVLNLVCQAANDGGLTEEVNKEKSLDLKKTLCVVDEIISRSSGFAFLLINQFLNSQIIILDFSVENLLEIIRNLRSQNILNDLNNFTWSVSILFGILLDAKGNTYRAMGSISEPIHYETALKYFNLSLQFKRMHYGVSDSHYEKAFTYSFMGETYLTQFNELKMTDSLEKARDSFEKAITIFEAEVNKFSFLYKKIRILEKLENIYFELMGNTGRNFILNRLQECYLHLEIKNKADEISNKINSFTSGMANSGPQKLTYGQLVQNLGMFSTSSEDHVQQDNNKNINLHEEIYNVLQDNIDQTIELELVTALIQEQLVLEPFIAYLKEHGIVITNKDYGEIFENVATLSKNKEIVQAFLIYHILESENQIHPDIVRSYELIKQHAPQRAFLT